MLGDSSGIICTTYLVDTELILRYLLGILQPKQHQTKLYLFYHNRNLPLAIEDSMAAIVSEMQLFCLSH